jgi:hypothetical protein
VIRGHRLVLRNPSTGTAIVQRIAFVQPGEFSVNELAADGTAGFGCTDPGRYSFERADGGTLHVQAIADPCEPRLQVLIAGLWSGLGSGSNVSPPPSVDTTSSPDVTPEPSPVESVPESAGPPPLETAGADAVQQP